MIGTSHTGVWLIILVRKLISVSCHQLGCFENRILVHRGVVTLQVPLKACAFSTETLVMMFVINALHVISERNSIEKHSHIKLTPGNLSITKQRYKIAKTTSIMHIHQLHISWKFTFWKFTQLVMLSVKSKCPKQVRLGLSGTFLMDVYCTLNRTQMARFMWATWGPPGSCRPRVGPMLAPWTLLIAKGVLCT